MSASTINSQTRETFDVATVNLNKAGGRGGYPGLEPGGQRFTAKSLPLVAQIVLAYEVTPDQISGIPSSFNTEAYDVEASCDHPIKPDQALRMLQSLLEDRFKLAIHREGKDRPIYALVIAPEGPKLHTVADEQSKPDLHRTERGSVYKSAPMATLSLVLSQQLDRPVVDQTGLTGRYDFTLQYAPEAKAGSRGEGRESRPSSVDLPSIFSAVREQLGLKLEPQKGKLELIVVDHVERPSDN